jgi:hypothetical protein
LTEIQDFDFNSEIWNDNNMTRFLEQIGMMEVVGAKVLAKPAAVIAAT